MAGGPGSRAGLWAAVCDSGRAGRPLPLAGWLLPYMYAAMSSCMPAMPQPLASARYTRCVATLARARASSSRRRRARGGGGRAAAAARPRRRRL
jgi:kynureninase